MLLTRSRIERSVGRYEVRAVVRILLTHALEGLHRPRSWELHMLSNGLFGLPRPQSDFVRDFHYFMPDKLAEAILTVPCGVNTHYENLDYTLNYLHLRKACPVGTARNSTPAPV